MKTIQTTLILFFTSYFGLAQVQLQQYFDGADTSIMYSLFPNISNDTNNIWQIGSPQKQIFHSASTIPYAIITDTINNYPVNNYSEFTIPLPVTNFSGGILAMRWIQKLDLDSVKDFGKIAISSDDGITWENAVDNPYVYNFYGYQSSNVDYDLNGNPGFTGTDTTWRDIWFCLDQFYFSSLNDTILLKFSIESDSIENNKEGWVIDNLFFSETWVHTINENDIDQMLVYPTIVKNRLNLISKKTKEFNIIEKIDLISTDGKLIKQWGKSPTKFEIDISEVPSGTYLLLVKTSLFEKSFKIFKE